MEASGEMSRSGERVTDLQSDQLFERLLPSNSLGLANIESHGFSNAKEGSFIPNAALVAANNEESARVEGGYVTRKKTPQVGGVFKGASVRAPRVRSVVILGLPVAEGGYLVVSGVYLNCIRSGCKFSWSRSRDGESWSRIDGSNTHVYHLTQKDTGKYLRVRITPINSDGYSGKPSTAAMESPVRGGSPPKGRYPIILHGPNGRADAAELVVGTHGFALLHKGKTAVRAKHTVATGAVASKGSQTHFTINISTTHSVVADALLGRVRNLILYQMNRHLPSGVHIAHEGESWKTLIRRSNDDRVVVFLFNDPMTRKLDKYTTVLDKVRSDASLRSQVSYVFVDAGRLPEILQEARVESIPAFRVLRNQIQVDVDRKRNKGSKKDHVFHSSKELKSALKKVLKSRR